MLITITKCFFKPHSKFKASFLMLVLMMLYLPLLYIQPFQVFAARDTTVPRIELSQTDGPTGTLLTIRGYNQSHPLGYGYLMVTSADPTRRDNLLVFGAASYGPDGTFTWTGPLPAGGNGFNTNLNDVDNLKVNTGAVAITFGIYSVFNGGEALFDVTDNEDGPFADRLHYSEAAMSRTWNRTDGLLAKGKVSRSWVWGPGYTTLLEPYDEAPNGWRAVSYYDKTRMEVTDPNAPSQNNPYYVSNGLLVREMVTGYLQLGDENFLDEGAANVPAAGDLDQSNPSPRFYEYTALQETNDNASGAILNQTLGLNGEGEVENNSYYNNYNVRAVNYVAETGHYIASPFWKYLNSTGLVIGNDLKEVQGRIFEPVFYATGLPITEAYWTKTRVGGEEKDVLVQLFERRVLTYTPSNPEAYRVEMGNVGLQYLTWRYTG